jgi:hypothetical protein
MFAKGTIAGCPTLLTFRQMINNTWIQLEEQQAHEVSIASVHQLMTAPPPMQKLSEIVSGFVLQCRGTSSTCAGIGVEKKDQNLLRMSTRELALLQLLPRARPKVGNDGVIELGYFSTFFFGHIL